MTPPADYTRKTYGDVTVYVAPDHSHALLPVQTRTGTILQRIPWRREEA